MQTVFNNNVVSVPLSLTNIEVGHLMQKESVKHLIYLVTSIKPVPINAFSAVFTEVKRS